MIVTRLISSGAIALRAPTKTLYAAMIAARSSFRVFPPERQFRQKALQSQVTSTGVVPGGAAARAWRVPMALDSVGIADGIGANTMARTVFASG